MQERANPSASSLIRIIAFAWRRGSRKRCPGCPGTKRFINVCHSSSFILFTERKGSLFMNTVTLSLFILWWNVSILMEMISRMTASPFRGSLHFLRSMKMMWIIWSLPRWSLRKSFVTHLYTTRSTLPLKKKLQILHRILFQMPGSLGECCVFILLQHVLNS